MLKEGASNCNLTVAVLTFNRRHFLQEALEAIQKQTYDNFIVKILDNASTDGTEDVVKPFLSDRRFEYVRHPQNIDVSRNYNFALTHCDTDFLLITHDDDRMKHDMLAKEISVFVEHPDVNLVSCENDRIDSNGRLLVPGLYSQMYKLGDRFFQGRHEFILGYLKGRNQISCPTAMLRMSTIRAAGLRFREDVGQPLDTIFWMELNCLPGRFAFIGQSLYEYRVHEGQDSSRNVLQTHVGLRTPVWDILVREELGLHLRQWTKCIDVCIVQAVTRLMRSGSKADKRLLRSLKKKSIERGRVNARLRWIFFCAIVFPNGFLLLHRLGKVVSRAHRRIIGLLRRVDKKQGAA